MLRYFIKRLLGMIPTLIIVAVCVFFFIHLLRATRHVWPPVRKLMKRRWK